MLKNDADIVTAAIKEGRYEELEYMFDGRLDMAKELVQRFPKLFEETAMKTNSDGSISEQTFVDYRKWSFVAVIEKIKANRRKLDL